MRSNVSYQTKLFGVALSFALLLLIGCGRTKELESGLTSKESLELVVVLNRAGITAERDKTTAGRPTGFRVTVPERDYYRALEVVMEHGLPTEKKEDLGSFTRNQGFVPNSPAMEQFRLDYALALQLEELLRAIPGVIDVSAVVRSNLHSQSRLDKTLGPGGVSVVVRYVPAASSLPPDVEEIQRIVGQMVPGSAPENIIIKLSRMVMPSAGVGFGTTGSGAKDGVGDIVPLTQIRPFFVFRIAEEDVSKARWQLGLYLLAFCCAGGVLGVVLGSYTAKRKLRRMVGRTGGASVPKSINAEASVVVDEVSSADRSLTGRVDVPNDLRRRTPTN